MTRHMTAAQAASREMSSAARPPLHVVGAGEAASAAERGMASIDAAGRLRVFEAGEVLFEQGDEFAGLYRVVSGLVGIRIVDESGHLSLLALAKSSDVLGYSPLLLGGGHVTSAVALQTSRIAHIEPSSSRALVRETPDVTAALLRQSTRDLAALQQKHIRMLTQEAHSRLAELLLSLVEHRHCDGDKGAFALPLSRQDVADFIGIRAETLSRAIRHLRDLGVASLNGRQVEIPSLSGLRRIADPEADSLACAV